MSERRSLNTRIRVASQPAKMKPDIIHAADMLVLAPAKRMCSTTTAIALVHICIVHQEK
jgi:hypothetical protein